MADARSTLVSRFVPKNEALRLQQLIVEMEQLIAAEIEDRRSNPRDDVLTEIVQTEPDPSIKCELPHLIAIVKIILTAGTETTGFLLGNATWLMLTLEGCYERVSNDLSRIPQLLEETMRFESPAQWSQRRCVVDTEIGGKPIPAGTKVLLMWAGANRDPSLFRDPGKFDLDRDNVRRHLGFGIGPHTCVGAPLARLEARVAMEQVLRRLRDLRLADADFEPAWVESPVIRGVKELPLRFAPGPRLS
jgi:cytochrome P450